MPKFRIAVPVSGFQIHEIDRETKADAFEGVLRGESEARSFGVLDAALDVDTDTNNWAIKSVTD